MGRLKHYRNCEVVIAPEEEPLKYAVGCEDEMVHQELKCCNAHNEIGKQNNGKRFLTDREIKSLVEQFVKDDDIIAQTYDEIAKRRKDKDFKYSLVKQGVSMTIVSRFCEMGIARPSAMKLAMGVVNILYDLYVADCQTKTEKKESKVIEEIVEAVPSVSEAIEETQEEPAPAVKLEKEPDETSEKASDSQESNEAEESTSGSSEKQHADFRRIVVSPKSLGLEDAVIEAGKIKSLMEMMDNYYYDYLSADASEKMQSFYCVFDILKKRYDEFEDGLQHIIYG
ncbi:hypothetical protein CC1_19500 [Coprococcus catus GD/7]|uniref:Uncharacterized protein n=1 Tax=Coprococcus catus GD/7 TaxID=717962 RepID=D4J8L0_9FIRM|nr:hypothetical protein [Coprococcus catus]CBK80681.1 hypothetical protein CC1_19500 [Coprococcus catus GD/7]